MSLMLDQALREVRVATDSIASKVQKLDSSTLVIIFAATLCAVLPLDISQLSFALIGAVLYALLQKQDGNAPKKPLSTVPRNIRPQQSNAQARSPKPSPKPKQTNNHNPNCTSYSAPLKIPAPEVYKQSIKPITAPSFCSKDWDGEVQELLSQITPTAEVHDIVKQLTQKMLQTIKGTIPEIEITGFASANLSCGKAFGVAVPEIEIVASVSPETLFRRLHTRSYESSAFEKMDIRKLQKSALRSCADQLVAAGFKFRRSAFKGLEPKVTLLAPAALGISTEPIPIDFSINVVTPLYNAALLTECGKIDMRTKELILLVKRWAKDRAICHTPKGHLSPYMWGLLTIHFLQVRENGEGALLPTLDHFEVSSGLLPVKAPWRRQKSQWTPPKSTESKQSVGALFKEFVQFFEKEFDWASEAVSIHTGQRVAASALKLASHVMIQDGASVAAPSIEDPFDVTRNLGECMNNASFARLKEELSRAQELCVRSGSLSELLEPWTPACPEVNEHQNDEN